MPGYALGNVRLKPEVQYYPDLKTLSRNAAEYVSALAERSVGERGIFTVALAGGRTPKLLYENLVQSPFEARMPWAHIHFFWGDERFVPPDHPDSNFGMAFRAMISRAPVLSENIHPIPTERASPEEVAEAYEKTLREFFGHSIEGDAPQSRSAENRRFPAFDLIMLGIGKDGHTASLFPGDGALDERERWVAAVTCPRGSPAVPRITLTLPVINRARCVTFLVSGVEKRDVVHSILNDPQTASHLYPAAMVHTEGKILWILDEEAAGKKTGFG